jgi:hypothetical protein
MKMTKSKNIYFDSLTPDKCFKTYDSIEIISHPSADEVNIAKTNEPIYPPTPLAEIVCAKCAKAFKYAGSIDPLIDLSISKKIECVGKVVDWWPANKEDEQVVENLMNKANKDLEERPMKTQINDLKEALEHAREVLTENKPCCHTRDKETGHHIDNNDKCKLCVFEQALAHIEEVLEETK